MRLLSALCVAVVLLMGSSAEASVVSFYNYFDHARVENNETLSWTIDFTELGFDANTVINNASLSISARNVDSNPDPIVIESEIFLGNLIPGNGVTTFHLPEYASDYTGSFEYLQDGLLHVSLTANEINSYTETVLVERTRIVKDWYHHSWFWGHWHYKTEKYFVEETITCYEAGSLKLKKSVLEIDFDEETLPNIDKNEAVPEPASLATLAGLFGCFGLGCLRRRRKTEV